MHSLHRQLARKDLNQRVLLNTLLAAQQSLRHHRNALTESLYLQSRLLHQINDLTRKEQQHKLHNLL